MGHTEKWLRAAAYSPHTLQHAIRPFAAQYEAHIELATHEMGVALPFRGHPAYMTQLFQSCHGMYLPTE